MANVSFQPYNGPAILDLQAILSFLVDLKPGAMKYLRFELDGVQDVVDELGHNVPKVGAKAAISPDVYAHFVVCTDNLTKIRAARAVAVKIAEVLEESEAYYVHEREGDISLIADAVRSSARRKDDSILASFEATLKYNAQIAEKAVKTRRKNAKAEAEAQAQAEAAAEAQAQAEADAEAEAENKPEADAEAEAENKPGADAHASAVKPVAKR